MTLRVAPAEKRTFYIERRGDSYELVKVWQAGHTITAEDVAFTKCRSGITSPDGIAPPDEQILAEQTVAIAMNEQGQLCISTADPAAAVAVANATRRLIRGERIEGTDP
jgi:hypothetical protein